jgi:acyl dehydratase
MSLERVHAELTARVGLEIHLSDWTVIDQARIDAFAAVTGDNQWLHTDPVRAATESPWNTTVAHGYLTLSLCPALRGIGDGPPYPGVRAIVNYGLNRARFMNAVKAGSRVRGRFRLLGVDVIGPGLEMREECRIEIDGEKRPACIAELVARLYF